nr:MAG TPA: Outer membrane protein [Caudoviricetes sp.]
MDKIILKNKTEFEIAEGASLGNIQIQSKDFNGIKSITDAFSEENISKVTFTHNDQTSGEYENLKYEGFSYMPNMGEDGTYTVTVNLRTKTEMEKAIDELKAGHESNAGAIQDLADMVAGGEV